MTLLAPHQPANKSDQTKAAHGSAGLAASNAWKSAALALCLGLLAVALFASLGIGAKAIAPLAAGQALWGIGTPETLVIINELRLPRTAIGLLAGMSLAVGGALIQALTRNPLADPGILGVNAGAGFAVVLAVAFLGITHISQYIWFAFAGAVLATLAVYLIGSRGRGGATPARLTLSGVALGAVLGGISNGMTLLNPEAFDRMRYWGAGTLNNRTLPMVGVIAPFVILGLVLAVLCTRSLNTLALGDEASLALGTNIGLTRAVVIAAVTLLCGAATAAAGPIGFVGLMIPHISRWIVGPDQRWILCFSMILGPVLLLVSDVLGRIVVPPGEMQVGVVTALLGAPVLIWLVRRKQASGL